MTGGDSAPLMRDLTAEDENPEVTELESLCMNCHEMGTTRLLLTRIPFFKEIIIMSFECPHCYCKDNEVKPASEIQEKGVRYTLKVDGAKMMSRQVVKQPSARLRIEELDFEAPEFTSKGSFTTIEGLLSTAVDGLQQQQPVRRAIDPDLANKIDEVIRSLEKYKTGEVPFTLLLEDISGNSFLENPYAPEPDPALCVEHFERTKLQNSKLGMGVSDDEEEKQEDQTNNNNKPEEEQEILKDEVLEFPGNCPICQSPTQTRMKMIDIPHFKEVVIMAISCEKCGYKSNDVKAGGGIESHGTKITFLMTDLTDLSRDVLTSETCTVSLPDLDVELSHSSEGGKFTTIEGLLSQMEEQMGRINPFALGDSANKEKYSRFLKLIEDITKVKEGKMFTTIVLDDPIGNSYLQNIYAPDDDPNLQIDKYERTREMEELFGIADMKITDYELDGDGEQEK